MPAVGAQPLIEVIIVNFNAGNVLTRCVQSVLSQQLNIHITVIDNASSDGSMATLDKTLGHVECLSLLLNDSNLGFACGVNAAVQGLTGDGHYLLILNPDCEMLPGSLAALVNALETDSQAALAGPMVVDGTGQAMRGTLRRFPDPWRSFLTFTGLSRLAGVFPALGGVEMSTRLPAEPTRAEAVSGACMLIRKAEFIGMGCLDGEYGLHCEDLDLMFRLNQQGLGCLFVPSARVFHAQGTSSSSRPVWVHWQKHRGMQRFFRKFQAQQHAAPFCWLVVVGIWLRFVLTLPQVLLRR